MSLRLVVLLVLSALVLAGCPEKQVDLAPRTEDLLRTKADPAIAALARRPKAPPFAAIVVFRSDVFLHQSATLERLGISLLDSFDNVAILLLDAAVTPPLLAENGVRKARYLSPPGSLARFHPAFLLSVLRLFGEDKEKQPVAFYIRFRDAVSDQDIRAVQAAGFAIRSRDGAFLTVFGPPADIFRLLEMNQIVYYEGSSNLRTM